MTDWIKSAQLTFKILNERGIQWIRKYLRVNYNQATSIYYISVLAGFAVVATLLLISILFIVEWRKKRAKNGIRKAVIVGEKGSGKTALIKKIAVQHQHDLIDTPTTEEVFIRVETNADKEMKLVDLEIVGMKQSLEKLQSQKTLTPLFQDMSCMVIMMNGKNPNVEQIASFVYALFHTPAFLEDPVPIMLAVNKSDIKGHDLHANVYYAIQKKIGEWEEGILDYEFRRYSPCTVDSCNCSVLTNSISTVNDFINASVN